MTLYEELKAAGVPTDNHESDLYFKRTDKSMEILKRHNKRATHFQNAVTMEMWVEAPFAFDPFWDAVAARKAKAKL